MQVQVSPEVGALLDEAVTVAIRRGKSYVGVEHLFEAVVSDPQALPRAFAECYVPLLHQTIERVYRDAWHGTPPDTRGEIFYTPRCAAVTHEAASLARKLRGGNTTAGHVLLAMLADAHAAPSRTLDALGRERAELIRSLRQELLGSAENEAKAVAETARRESGKVALKESPEESEEDLLHIGDTASDKKVIDIESFTRDLTQLAREGKLSPATSRDGEMVELVEVLARQGKHNVMLVGEAGTGKTKIVEGLACSLAHGQFSQVLQQTRILELNLSAMMAGTQYRGTFEKKVFALLEELHRSEDTILFIDEVHLMMGAGATDGDSMDLANVLKPALGRGELRCIGATTVREYRKFIAKDPAIERRFQMVRVEELSSEGTMHVLRVLRPKLAAHHGVHIKSAALEAAIRLSDRYLPNRSQPDKAIDVIDQACARRRISLVMNAKGVANAGQATDRVTPHHVRQVVSQMAAVPIEEISQEERLRLAGLEIALGRAVVGQDDAIAKVVAAVKKSRAGLADPNRPDAVFLFLGPTGVGKTQLAKEIAKQVFGSSDHLIRFDMSEYVEPQSVSRLLGAAPGYAGHGEDGLLTAAAKDTPFSVLLFDEIEKAHSQIYDVLLPVLDEGRIKDADGRYVSFRNSIIVFTSNVGAAALSGGQEEGGVSRVMEHLRESFRPEFINRIDEIVPFYPLLFEDVRGILKTMIDELRVRMQDRSLGIRMYQGAYEFLATEGYSAEFGARELRRAVERHVANPIGAMIIEGAFEPGDMIDVLMEDGVLTHRKGRPHSRQQAVAS